MKYLAGVLKAEPYAHSEGVCGQCWAKKFGREK